MVQLGSDSSHSRPVLPERTCIGCRSRQVVTGLIRMVARVDDSGAWRVVVDQHRALPGRGAWLHPDSECLHQADRRRAFGRALRMSGSPNIDDVRRAIGTHPAGPVPRRSRDT